MSAGTMVIRSDDGGPVPILEVCAVTYDVNAPGVPLGVDVILGFRDEVRRAMVWFALGSVSINPRSERERWRVLPSPSPEDLEALRQVAVRRLNGAQS